MFKFILWFPVGWLSMSFHWQSSLEWLIASQLLFFLFQKTVETTAMSKIHKKFWATYLYGSVEKNGTFLITTIFVLQILQLPEWNCKKCCMYLGNLKTNWWINLHKFSETFLEVKFTSVTHFISLLTILIYLLLTLFMWKERAADVTQVMFISLGYTFFVPRYWCLFNLLCRCNTKNYF